MLRRIVSRVVQSRPFVCSQCARRADQRSQRGFHNTRKVQQGHENVLALLEERGYVNQVAGDRNALSKLLRTRKLGFYAGIDPTAPSLHLGHLLPLMVLFWVSLHGHKAVSLVGGATARVGDPSGRLTSRARTADEMHARHSDGITGQTQRLWKNVTKHARRRGNYEQDAGKHILLNNACWLQNLSLLDFLKHLGSGVRLGAMLGRDTVKNKMEKGDGMSFAEFTYPLLQAWDWWHMYDNHDVQVQVGGSDQYGNIVAGIDAVKSMAQSGELSVPSIANSQSTRLDGEGRLKEDFMPMGITVPLLTTNSGEKFGKSAGNAVWLDRSMTSPFDLYGFLLRSSDVDVVSYLKLFTFVPTEDIKAIMAEHMSDPGKRKAQHLLASEVLELVHGQEEAEKTRTEHQEMRNPNLASIIKEKPTGLKDEGETALGAGEQRTLLPSSLVLNTPFARILYHAGLVASKSEGARLVAKGGAYVATKAGATDNDELTFVQIRDQKPEDVAGLLIDERLVLRVGKWKVRVIEVVEDDAVGATNGEA